MDQSHGDSDQQLPVVSPPSQLRLDLIIALSDFRRHLQKWHTAVQRLSGDAAADVLRGQGRVLALFAEHSELSQRDMGKLLGIRPQSLGEILAKLEKAGYITRHPSERDRRIHMVRITEAGRRCASRFRPAIPFRGFSDEEIEQFLSYLDRAAEEIDYQSALLMEQAAEDEQRESTHARTS